MSEFVFKNLSVKVVPDQGARFCSDESVTVLACTPCTDLCTGTVPVCDDGLTDLFSDIGLCPACRGPGTSPGFVDPFTNIVLPAGEVLEELAALRDGLQVAMRAVEVAEEKAQSPEGISRTAGIDALRTRLLGAVAELDEYRATLE